MGRPRSGTRGQGARQRRITQDLTLERLTLEDSDWLLRASVRMMAVQPAAPDTICIRKIAFRYRPGKIGIADALDAVEQLFEPFAALGAMIEPRDTWEIVDEEEEEQALAALGPASSFAEAMRRTMLRQRRLSDGVDLAVDAIITFDANADDLAAAAIYWLALGLRVRSQ